MAHTGETHLFLENFSTYSPHLGLGETPDKKLKPESNVPEIHRAPATEITPES